MDQTIELEKNTSSTADEDPSAKLLTLSKNLRNGRLSWDVDHPKRMNQDIVRTSSLRDVRRSSATAWAGVWHLQKETILADADIKVYKRRWIVLFIFVLSTSVGSYQWSMYTIIANVITEYYKVSNFSVDFTALSFLVTYFVAFLPANWILNNLGVRWAMLIGSFLHVIGCGLRIFSVPPDKFWLAMIGQCIVGLSQVFVPLIPTRLSAMWFPAYQVSTACALSFNGVVIGNAAGFLLPPLLVRNSKNPEDIAEDLNLVNIGLAACAILSLVLTAAFFQEEPPLPPSQAQKLKRIRTVATVGQESPKGFFSSIKRLLVKRTYTALLISVSLVTSVFCALATLLNQILISHFPGHEKEVGIFGLLLVVPGIASSALSGYILDRTHAFKKTAMVLYIFTFAGWIAFAVFLRFGDMSWMYICSAIIGFATGGLWPVVMELAVEITFPEPESTTAGLMSAVVQISQVLCTLVYGYMLQLWGDDIANTILAAPIVIAFVMLAFLRPKLKRQAAQKTSPELLEDIDV